MLVKISDENVKLLEYMVERYKSTAEDLINEAIHEYYSEERYDMKQRGDDHEA